MQLYIDTTDGEHISLILAEADTIIAHKKLKAQHQQSEKLLPAIEKLLHKSRLGRGKVQDSVDLNKPDGIVVVNGPGPFTATRIGVTIANALAYAWQVPVTGIMKLEVRSKKELIAKGYTKTMPVEPVYDREPNITVSSKY